MRAGCRFAETAIDSSRVKTRRTGLPVCPGASSIWARMTAQGSPGAVTPDSTLTRTGVPSFSLKTPNQGMNAPSFLLQNNLGVLLLSGLL